MSLFGKRRVRVGRRASETLLLVGEGDAEFEFLQHLKSIYIYRGCGKAVTIKNAHGKGARNVVEHAIRQRKNADYDHCAAMFDTDTDWNTVLATYAHSKRIITLPIDPCIEGLLLGIHNVPIAGQTSGQLKALFRRTFRYDAHHPQVLLQHFPRKKIEDTGSIHGSIFRLLELIRPSQ